jgi:hypothetical protein
MTEELNVLQANVSVHECTEARFFIEARRINPG